MEKPPRVESGGWQHPDHAVLFHFEAKLVSDYALSAENLD